MIFYSIPYNTNKNIGKYYNDFMRILPNDDDYACFVDGDTIFTTENYGNIIEEITKEYSHIGCFTATTNRVGCEWQIAPKVDMKNNDMRYHRVFGYKTQKEYKTHCIVTGKQPI